MISMSSGVMPSCASIFRRNRKSTAKRLGIAIRFPLSCRKCWYGESLRTMITAPERWPNETILTGYPLVGQIHHQRRQHVGRLDLPAMSDSLISGQPLYLLNSYSKRGAPGRAGAVAGCLRHAGDRKSQVAGHRQAAHLQRPLLPRTTGKRAEGQSADCHEPLEHLSASEERRGHM